MMKGIHTGLFSITSLFILGFCTWSLVDVQGLGQVISDSFSWSITQFGFAWQIGLLLTFILSLGLLALPGAGRKMGVKDRPEFNWFQWSSMILCTLLAGGGVFWAAGEPIAHFISPPPYFESTEDTHQKAIQALAQSYLHWGFLAWSILGSLTTIILMKLHYEDGHPLAPRTLLIPVFGPSVAVNWVGTVVDACCIISVVAGTV